MTHEESTRKFTSDTFWAFLSIFVMIVVTIVVGLLLGNIYGPSGLGSYSIVQTIWTIAAITAGFGVPNTVIKFIAEKRDDPAHKNVTISTAMLIGAVIGTLASVALFLLSWPLESVFPRIEGLGPLLRIVSPAFPFFVINDIFIGSMNAMRKMRQYALFEVFRRGNVLVYTLIFIWMGYGITGAVFALVLSPVSAALVALAVHRKFFTFCITGFSKYSKKILKFSSQLYMASSVEIINAQAATIIIGLFLSDSEVGIYATALFLFSLMVVISQAIQRVTYPAFSTHFAQKRRELIQSMTDTLVRFSFVFLSIVSLLLMFYVDDIIRLIFPGKYVYLAAVTPLRFLALIGVVYGIMVTIGGVFTSASRPDISLKMGIFQAVFNISVALILVPLTDLTFLGFTIGGVNGAAIAYGLTLLLTVIIFFILLKRLLSLSVNVKFIVVGYVLFLLTVTLGYLSTFYLGLEGNLVGFILVPVYSIATFYLGVVRGGGLQKLREILTFWRRIA